MITTDECKIVILGGGGVGKSALTIRFVSDTFLDEYDPTIEDSYRKQVVVNDKSTQIDILDTAGQEEFASMQDQWMREGQGFLLVYNCTAKDTFEALFNEKNGFIHKISRSKDLDLNKIPIVIAGNKVDLKDETNSRHVKFKDAKDMCAKYNFPFYETSAKTKKNHEECFIEVVKEYQRLNNEKGGKKKKKKGGKMCTLL